MGGLHQGRPGQPTSPGGGHGRRGRQIRLMGGRSRKIAIAMALFGRAGEQMIPLLNQGPEGMEQLDGGGRQVRRDSRRPSLIARGTEAEDCLKSSEWLSKAEEGVHPLVGVRPWCRLDEEAHKRHSARKKEIASFSPSSPTTFTTITGVGVSGQGSGKV